MIKLDLESLKKVSFPDVNITNIDFNPLKKQMFIEAEGAWLEDESNSRELHKCVLKFQNWKVFKIRKYKYDVNLWINVSLKEFEELKDICEFDYMEKETILRGFGKTTGLWMEYVLVSPNIEFEFEEKNK